MFRGVIWKQRELDRILTPICIHREERRGEIQLLELRVVDQPTAPDYLVGTAGLTIRPE